MCAPKACHNQNWKHRALQDLQSFIHTLPWVWYTAFSWSYGNMVSVRNIASSSQPLIQWTRIVDLQWAQWFALLAGINWPLPENSWRTQGTSLHLAHWKQHHIRTLWMSKVNILHSRPGWCEKSTGLCTPQKWPQQALQLKDAPSHQDSNRQSLSLEVEGKQCLAGTFAPWLCRRDDFFLSKLYVLLQGSTKALRLWQRQAIMLRFWRADDFFIPYHTYMPQTL